MMYNFVHDQNELYVCWKTFLLILISWVIKALESTNLAEEGVSPRFDLGSSALDLVSFAGLT